MVNIELQKPVKLTNFDTILKITFDKYDANLVSIIKSRNIKSYNPIDKSWEIPVFEFKKLVLSLSNYEIKYITSIEKINDAIALSKENYTPTVSVKAGLSIKNTLNNVSLFANFTYNKELVAFFKSNKCTYDNNTKLWEFDYCFLNKFVEKCEDNNYKVRLMHSVHKYLEIIKKNNEIIEESKAKDWDALLSSYNFTTKPYKYQLEGITRGLECNNLLLTDEQGLGKTLQSIYIADIKSREEKYKYTLIVCGVNGLKYNWIAEIEEHLNEEAYILGSRLNRNGNLVDGSVNERIAALDKLSNGEIENRFIITNIETLRNQTIKEKIKKLCAENIIGMTIIDEIHRVSNMKSQQGDALHYLKSRNKIGLTGTPVVNKPLDLYAPLSWLGVENRSYYDFKHTYGKYITRFGKGREYEELVEYINLSELKDILNTVMLRREKKDVLDLPEVVYVQEFIEMSKEQAKLYNAIRKELIEQIEDIVLSSNPLAKFTRLRQACSCPGILDSTITKNPKYNRIIELIEDLKESGQKAIIYSNFATAICELDKIMKINGFTSYTVTGEEKNKKAVIDKFKNNGDVLLGSIQALGTGYTITEATTIIFLDLPWTYASLIQAVDRAHRIGQKNNITVINLLANDTVDIKIHTIVKKKQDLFEDLMEGKDIKGVNRKKLTKSLLGI